ADRPAVLGGEPIAHLGEEGAQAPDVGDDHEATGRPGRRDDVGGGAGREGRAAHRPSMAARTAVIERSAGPVRVTDDLVATSGGARPGPRVAPMPSTEDVRDAGARAVASVQRS